jgi:hypothetical protein
MVEPKKKEAKKRKQLGKKGQTTKKEGMGRFGIRSPLRLDLSKGDLQQILKVGDHDYKDYELLLPSIS